MRRLLVVVLGLVAAGCGSGDGGDGGDAALSKSDYEAAVRDIRLGSAAMRVDELFLKLVTDEPRLPQRQCADAARNFEGSLSQIVDAVDRLQPPTEVADLQDEFVAAARDSIEAVADAAGDVEAGKLRCGSPLNRRIYGLPSTERAQGVLERFERRGYHVGLGE